MFKLLSIAHFTCLLKIMHKILQARLQEYINRELPDVLAGFKAEKPEIKLPTSDGSLKKQESSDYAKAFDCVDHNKLWKILKKMVIPGHLTCLLRNLYIGQKATVRTGHGTTDWFKIGKGVRQGYILSPCLFDLYAEYIIQNVWLDDSQAGIKIARRNINNLRYADDTP